MIVLINDTGIVFESVAFVELDDHVGYMMYSYLID